MAIKAAFISQKGGTGKSTSCILAANALSQHPFNWQLSVLDADPQQSIYTARQYDLDRFDVAAPYEIHTPDKDVLSTLSALDESNDLVLIDTAGKLDVHLPAEYQQTLTIIDVADIVFIPVHIGRLSLLSTFDFVDALDQYLQRIASAPEVYLYPSIYKDRLNATHHTANILQQIKQETGMNTLSAGLKQYSAFMDLDTFRSMYRPESNNSAMINATAFVGALSSAIQK
jgi:cellulose biosynthesis protein BcsQ